MRLPLAPVLAALLAATQASAATAPRTQKNFVACPIVQDTKTVPCWLAEYKGETYYLGIQTDISAEWYPPYLEHKTLIEGTVSDEPRICGGVVLKPLKISVLPELDRSCNEMRPERADYQVPFAPRGPGPSKGGLAFAPAPGQAAVARPAPPPPPQPPFQSREFVVPYEFDAKAVTGRTSRVLQQAIAYARAIKASRIEVVGYRGQTLMTDGPPLVEAKGVAEARARQVGELLQDVGVKPAEVKVSWQETPEKADGLKDWSRRRATVLVRP
jgi:hypothetical protein